MTTEPNPPGDIFRAGASRQGFPLTTIHEVTEYLAGPEAPTVLVVFEFSGAVLKPLLARGIKAMSVDVRAAEHDGPHFQGDFREVLELKVWDAIYFVGPNCYQHLQGDINCLRHKIADCRAYWGAAFVLWCICYRGAKFVIVEQPNTIGHKYYPLDDMEGVRVEEFSTTQYGDDKHKFVRLTLVNATIPPPTQPRDEEAVRAPRAAHTTYEDEEARDKARSSFAPYLLTCEAIAAAAPIDTRQGGTYERGYSEHVRSFGRKWLRAGMPLPPGWDNPTGAPLDQESKDYQLVRGPGDGRRPRAMAEDLPSLESTEGEAGQEAKRGQPSRRAEPGDSVVATDPLRMTLRLIDRELAKGSGLKPELEARYTDIEHERAGEGVLFFDERKGGVGEQAGMPNWANHPFRDPTIRGSPFDHVEQYIQFTKAVFADKLDTAEAIRREESAPGCLMRGRALRGLDQSAWAGWVPHVAERAIYLKYAQNATLRQRLLDTGNQELVYASGKAEQVWSVGMSRATAQVSRREDWGANMLGKALMRARLRLKLGEEPPLPRDVKEALASRGYLMGRPVPGQGDKKASSRQTGGKAASLQPSSTNIWPALKALDASLRPKEKVLDCGGSGRCGNNSLALTLAKAGVADVSGQDLRIQAVSHATELVERDHIFSRGGGSDGVITTRYLLTRSLASWPTNGERVEECTAEEWIDKMRRSDTWVDAAFLAIAADLYRVRIQYHAVRADGTLSHVGFIEPSDTTAPRAIVKLALVIEQHYSAIVPCEDTPDVQGPDAGEPASKVNSSERQGGGLLDGALIPSASQLLMAMEESKETAKRRAHMAENEQEAQDLLWAMHADSVETPSTTILEAMRASGEAQRISEEADLRRAIEKSRLEAQPDAQESLRGAVAASLESLKESQLEKQAQEDLDMSAAIAESLKPASEEPDPTGGSCDPRGYTSPRDEDQDGEGNVAQDDLILDSDDELGWLTQDDLILDSDDELPGREKGQVNFAATGVEETLARIDEESMTASTVIITPLTVEQGEIAVLVPTEQHLAFGFDLARASDPAVVEACERAVEEGLPAMELASTTGFVVGTDSKGTKMVGVATRLPSSVVIARDRRQRAAAVAKGATAVWCLLAAVAAGSTQQARSAVAVAAASHFVTHDATTTSMLRMEATARRESGWRAGKADYLAPRRPVIDEGGATTPRELVEWSQSALGGLKSALLDAGDSYYQGWVDRVRPLRISELSAELLDKKLYLRDERLGRELFAPLLPVYETPWLPRMPAQEWSPKPGCETFGAQNVFDLLSHGARDKLKVWFEAARRDAACLEREGDNCDRSGRPPTIMIGQDQVVECARGYVFDCRRAQGGCQPLDFRGAISTDFDLANLEERFRGYPDQRLASNILEGIRLEADLELAALLSPQLVSAGIGYDSVQSTVRELEERDFYDFFAALPFWPIIVVGQGSRIKKVGSKKYRRTSDFSGPHKRVVDGAGNVAVPINEASKSYAVPKWIAGSPRPEVRQWANDKYAHVPQTHRAGEQPSVRYKFPKEHKPALTYVLRDTAILSQASMEMGEPIFAFLEDAAHYFSQFGYSPEELWKSNVILNARLGDLTDHGTPLAPGQLVFISEKRLGFGSFASSNIAQRFSNAVTGWTLEAFDRLEREARREHHDPLWEEWVRKRAPLQAACERERPKRQGEANTDCTQTRLAVMHMYQDDPVFVVVGVDRTMRMLAAWREVTESINIEMAGPEKRQIGGDVEWIGVGLLAAIGLVAIPVNKLLRARDAIIRAIRHEITFGEYRSLVGLLEHLRFVARLEADATNALYRPHGRSGESQSGPATIVHPTALMRVSLEKWLDVIMTCAGAVVTIVFTDAADARLQRATTIVAASSDAAGDGKGQPGMGGYIHGFYWRVALPPDVLAVMHITGWETLAACVNILVTARIAGKDATLALQVDALVTPYVVSNQKSKSEDLQAILQKLLADKEYSESIAGRLTLRHLSGDGNVPADLISRGLWEELARLGELLRVRLMRVSLTVREVDFVMALTRAAAERKSIPLSESLLRAMVAPPPTIGGDAYLEPRREAIMAKRRTSMNENFLGKKRRNCVDGDGASSESEDPANGQAEVIAYLRERRMEEFAKRLFELGVATVDDLYEVRAEDLQDMGFKTLHIRRFFDRAYKPAGTPELQTDADTSAARTPIARAGPTAGRGRGGRGGRGQGRCSLASPAGDPSPPPPPRRGREPSGDEGGDGPRGADPRRRPLNPMGRHYSAPIEHVPSHTSMLAPSTLEPERDDPNDRGLELRSARPITKGEIVARYGDGQWLTKHQWHVICGIEAFPEEWGAFLVDRGWIVRDSSWETNRDLTLPRPRWTYIQHSRRRANLKLVREGPTITWVAKQDLLPGETYFYDYGGHVSDLQDEAGPRIKTSDGGATEIDSMNIVKGVAPKSEGAMMKRVTRSSHAAAQLSPWRQALALCLASAPTCASASWTKEPTAVVVANASDLWGGGIQKLATQVAICAMVGVMAMRTVLWLAQKRRRREGVPAGDRANAPCDLGPVPCDECEHGFREPACDNDPPTCGAWYCSRGGPPCYGGSPHPCECNDDESAADRLSPAVKRITRTSHATAQRTQWRQALALYLASAPTCASAWWTKEPTVVVVANAPDLWWGGIQKLATQLAICALVGVMSMRVVLRLAQKHRRRAVGPAGDHASIPTRARHHASPTRGRVLYVVPFRNDGSVRQWTHMPGDPRLASIPIVVGDAAPPMPRSPSPGAPARQRSPGPYRPRRPNARQRRAARARHFMATIFLALTGGAMCADSSSTPSAQEVIRYPFVPLWASGEPRQEQVAQGVAQTAHNTPPSTPTGPLRRQRRRTLPAAGRTHPYMAPAYGVTRLRSDETSAAQAFAQELHRDRTPGRIDAPLRILEEMAMSVAEARNDGVNPRTASKDAFAWREFQAFAELRGFDPNLQSEWARRFPERESLKMASFLLFRAQRSIPRSKRDAVSKPMSIFQNYLALRRVFKARNVELTPAGSVRDTLRGLLRRFVRRYGVEQLRPKRVEPVTPALIQQVVDLGRAGTSQVNGRVWDTKDWTCFIVTAWMVINLSVGSRKGESTKLPGDVDGNDWFTRASVSVKSKGRVHVDPPLSVWRRLTEGDLVLLANNGSKCDAFGVQHGTEPIVLPYHDEPLNAAKWIRDIALRYPVEGSARKDVPLFATAQGTPFTDTAFSTLINGALTAVVGPTRSALLSPHSWRVWLASSLRMCNATDARIQAMGRWLNPDSIKIYARMTEQEYASWVDKLMKVKRIDTARTTNLPVMDMADAIAMWGDQLKVDHTANLAGWEQHEPADRTPPPPPLVSGDKVSVYWTELKQWYTGTFTSSRVEASDDGGKQRASRIMYDATGPWAQCTAAALTYWHCLDDEQWHRAGEEP